MAKPADTSNAHLRSSGARQSSETIAEDAHRLLNDPAFVRGFERVREGCVRQLEAIEHDGSGRLYDYEQEICRTLRTLNSLKRSIAAVVDGQKLRVANFARVNEKGE